jgi:transcription elongation factor GreA
MMSTIMTVELTVNEWRKTHDELWSLQERRRAANPPDVEWRIAELESILARASPSTDNRTPGTIGLDSHVTVLWVDDGQEEYHIVEPADAAPLRGRISYESPIGQALIGRRAGDFVDAMTPSGPARLKVVAVH